MIDIKSRLKKSFEECQNSKLIYEDIPFYRRIDFWLWVITILFSVFISFLTYRFEKFQFIILFCFVVIVFGFFMLLNQERKYRLKRRNIQYNKGVLKHWMTEDFQVEKQTVFYKSLKDNGLIHETYKDVELIREYELLCDEESTFLKSNLSYIWGGGIFVLFLLAVWNEVIRLLFEESQNGDIMETLRLIVVLLFLIYFVIYLVFLIDRVLVSFTNSTSRKYKSMGRLLKLIRLNLLIEYQNPHTTK